jgi:hypothetical protein
MKDHIYFLAFWIAAAPWGLEAEELPIVFGRSGQSLTLSVGGDEGKTVGSVALWAFGQRWGKPMMVKGGAVEIVAPSVRVPVVFRVMPTHDSKAVLSELVVYPGAPFIWDKDAQFAAAGTPNWFDTWCEAVGLPIQKLKGTESLNADKWRMLEKPSLLILGGRASGNCLATICRLAAECKINVLALEENWFDCNETANRDVFVSPKQAIGLLTDLQAANWSLPPTFRQNVLRVSNRQTWIAGPEHPLVEEIRAPQRGTEGLRTVFSYLPWQQQLGRSEMTDRLFLRLLTEAAKGARGRSPLEKGRWRLLYPAAKAIEANERPVLAAALNSEAADVGDETESRETYAYVVDVRGKMSPPSDLFDAPGMKTIEARISVRSPLLILGDDPILDSWKWLELDRPRHQSSRAGVLWWPDNSLPPSIDSQLRLMQQFTEWNISLEDISQKVLEHDKDKNDH